MKGISIMPGRQRRDRVEDTDTIDEEQTRGGRRQTGPEIAASLNRYYERLTGEPAPSDPD